MVTDVIYPLVRANLESNMARGMPVPPLIKLLSVLRFYATGSYQVSTLLTHNFFLSLAILVLQIVCGDLYGISQPTMCQTVKKISFLLSSNLPHYVQLPNAVQARECRRKFYNKAFFPGVIGCIDCTHIPISCPNRARGEIFRNRKGYFSLNVQVVGGPDGEILDIVVRWPGSVHDSRIFENSSLKVKFDTNQTRGLLLGDSGYGQSAYLFTPVGNPQTEAEMRYNNAHIATRQSVERLFGIWKRRFPCLSKKLANNISTTTYIISACAVLHNIGIRYKEGNIDEQLENGAEQNEIHEIVNPFHNNDQRGIAIKRAFIAQHFQ